MSKFLSHLLFGLFFVEWELIQVNLLNCGKSYVGEKKSLHVCAIQVLSKWKLVFCFVFSFLFVVFNGLLMKHSPFSTMKNLHLEEDGNSFVKGLISFCKI